MRRNGLLYIGNSEGGGGGAVTMDALLTEIKGLGERLDGRIAALEKSLLSRIRG